MNIGPNLQVLRSGTYSKSLMLREGATYMDSNDLHVKMCYKNKILWSELCVILKVEKRSSQSVNLR